MQRILSTVWVVWIVAVSADPLDASIEELQAQLSSGAFSSVDLVDWYVRRIEAYDQQGPALNAIQHMNEDARAQAQALDDERGRSGPRSLLHGIPVLVKDNYETIDAPTTAGSAIIEGHWPKNDATQVAKLKAAGAIILAKTTMHEFAFGWTTRGSAFGMTKNPYDPDRHAGGSSGGTGAGVAANFGAAGMGSDTCGSIRVPSAHNNLVGLRGTQGLSSRQGIVPLSSSRDIGGPLARSTRDLAIMLDATVGYDPADPQTTESRGKIPSSYLADLRHVDLTSLRLGVLNDWFEDDASTNARIRHVLATLAEGGASIVEIGDLAELKADTRGSVAFLVDDYDIIHDLTAYLRRHPNLPVQSFESVAAHDRLEPVVAGHWANILADPERKSRAAYLEAHAAGAALRRQLLALMHDHDVDVLVYPTATEEAVPLGEEQGHFNCKLAAASGLPAISVPAGFGANGMPVAIEFLAEAWAEQKLLNLAATVEHLVPVRRPPQSTPALD